MARPATPGGTAGASDDLAMRRCLAPSHNHTFLTSKAVRICPRGRLEIAGIDVVYGVEDRGPLVFPRSRQRAAPTGLAAAMVEG